MKNLTSSVWWKAAGNRALRTALVLAAPYAATVIYDGTWLIMASVAVFGALVSLLTSLRGIVETTDRVVPLAVSIFERAVKTAAQALIAAFGTATTFEAVTWSEVPALVGTAVLGTLFLTVISNLPNTADPVAPTVLVTATVDEVGNRVETEVPVVAPVNSLPDATIVKPPTGSTPLG